MSWSGLGDLYFLRSRLSVAELSLSSVEFGGSVEFECYNKLGEDE
jgi:hypothetical protein